MLTGHLQTATPISRYTAQRLGRVFLMTMLFALTTALAASAQPAFTKVFTPDTIGPGSVSTLRFDITNGSGVPVTDLDFTDVLPADVTLANPANPFSDCGDEAVISAPDGGGTFSFTDGEVSAFSSCFITVDVTSSTVGMHMNVTGDLTSSAGNSGTASDDLTVAIDRPSFSKSFSPSTVSIGSRSTLTFTIDNSLNASDLSSLSFVDNFPVGLEVADPSNASFTCGGPNPNLTVGENSVSFASFGLLFPGFEVLLAGETCTVIVDVVATGSGRLINSSDGLFSNVGDSGKANAALDVTAGDLLLAKSFLDDPVSVGATVDLEFTVSNRDRNNEATAVAFTDSLEATLTGLAPSGALPTDPCGVGSTLNFAAGILSLSGGTIPAEGSCTFTVSLLVPASSISGSYPNATSTVTGMVAGSPVVGDPALDTLFINDAPILTKTFIPNPAAAGGTTTVEFTITSTSPTSAATDITFFDDFPTELPTAAGTLDPGFCGAGSTSMFTPLVNTVDTVIPARLTIMGADLAPAGMPGDSCTFSFTMNVAEDVADVSAVNTTSPISATVNAVTVVGSPATDTLTILGGLSLVKLFSGPVLPGNTVDLEFTVSHSEFSPSEATAITFSDDLNAVLPGTPDLTIVTALPRNDDCGTGSVLAATASGLELTGGTLMPGESCTFSVTLEVPAAAAPGSFTNTTSNIMATVSGLTVTGIPGQDTLTVIGLTVSKEFTDDPVIPGDTVTLEFTLDNTNSTFDATSISFSDTLSTLITGLAAIDPPLPASVCGGTLLDLGFLLLNGASVLAGETCTFSLTLIVPPNAPDGMFANVTSTPTALVDGSIVVLPPANDILQVNSNLLALSKEFTDDPVAPGDTVTLEFNLTNQGADQATNIAFDDDLGAALSGLVANSVDFNDCGFMIAGLGTSSLMFTDGTLASLATCTVRLTLQVPMGATGIFTNTTTAPTGTIGGLPVDGDPTSDDLTIQVLNFSKAFSGDATAGGTVVLSFTLENLSTESVSELDFTDDLDAVLSGLEATGLMVGPMTTPLPANDVCGPGSVLSGTSFLTLEDANLLPGGSCTFNVLLQMPVDAVSGTFLNTTSDLTQIGIPVADPATASLTVLEADLSITKTDGVTTATPGTSITYTIVATNNGPSDVMSAMVTDTFPAVLTCSWTSVAAGGATGNSSSSGDLNDTLMMPVGSSVTYTASCFISSGATGVLSNTATISSELADLTPENNSATDDDTDLAPETDLAVTKSDGVTSAVPGETVTYTIVASNNGPSDELAASLQDDLSQFTSCTFTSVVAGGASGNTAAGAGDLDETLSLPVGSSVTYTVVCTIDPSATGFLVNTVNITASERDSTPGNDSATDDNTELMPEADLQVTKTDGVTTAVPGETVTYTIVVSNSGPSDDPAASLIDDLSQFTSCDFTSVAAGGATGNTAVGSGDLAETLSLPVGGMVTYTVVCTIDSAATGFLSNTATATASVTDPEAGNDSATDDDTELIPEADVQVTKTDGVTTAVPGETVTYTIVASNAGPSDDPAVSLADDLSQFTACNYTSVAAGGATGNTAAGSGSLTETLSLPSGASVTYTVVCTIDSAATGTLSNTVTVTPSVDDPDEGNNSATDDDTDLVPMADVEVTKTDGVTMAVPGETVTYTIVALNNGPSDEPAASLADDLSQFTECTFTSVAAGGATGNTPAGSGDLAETLSLPAGSSVTYTVICTIDVAATGFLSNTATITASVTDPDGGNNSATDDDTELVPTADLEITKDGPAEVAVGQSLTYTLVVTSNGPSIATNVELDDPTPTDLVFVEADAPCEGGFPCDLGDLAAGESVEVTVTFDVPADYGGPKPIVNTATVTSDAEDNTPANNSATVMTEVTLDNTPPVVTDVSTAAGPLAACDTVRQPITAIEVTIEDDLTEILNADDPASYLLVGSGPDGDFSTLGCGPVGGDDVAIEIVSLSLMSVEPVVVDVDLGVGGSDGLEAGLYRFFVCDTISDSAGNTLDGDFEVPFFRADPLNLFENGHFDDCPVSLDPWIPTVTAPNTIQPGTPGTDDVIASPFSASAEILHSADAASSLAQCVPVQGGVVHRLVAQLRFDPVASALASFAMTCELFDAAACAGASLGAPSTVSVLEDEGGAWVTIEGNLEAPAEAVSALCDFSVEPVGTDLDFSLFLDGLFLGVDGTIFTIFSDGFESGDTSAWSLTTP